VDLRDTFFDELYEIANKDSNVLFLTADMDAFSLRKFKKDLPQQYINVGVSEQNLINVAAGLALEGKYVFVYAIAPFIVQRCYEQIKVSLSYMNLPVTIIGMGPGVMYGADGPTHHCIQDIANMRVLPNIRIYSVSDETIARNVVKGCLFQGTLDGVNYVRLDKGEYSNLYQDTQNFAKGYMVHGEGSTLIITTGTLVHRALEVQKEISDVRIIDLFLIKPYSILILDEIKKAKQIITLEEHSIIGGIGSLVSEIIADNNLNIPLKRLALKEDYSTMIGSREWIHKQNHLDKESIISAIERGNNNVS